MPTPQTIQKKKKKCCETCSTSKYALRGKMKEKFNGVCGLVCGCHRPEEKSCDCDCHNQDLVARRDEHCIACSAQTDWEQEFDKQFPKDDGLFQTESGWRIKTDPKKLKSFIHNLLKSTKEEAYEMGWEEGRQILQDLPSRQDTIQEILEIVEGMKIVQGKKGTADYTRTYVLKIENYTLEKVKQQLLALLKSNKK